MPDDAGTHSTADETEREGARRQAEVKRAIETAERAGLSDYRVEIAPDGTIAIVVGSAGGPRSP